MMPADAEEEARRWPQLSGPFRLYDGVLVSSSKKLLDGEEQETGDGRSTEGDGEGDAAPSLADDDADAEAEALRREDGDSDGSAWRCPGARRDGCDAPGCDPRCCHSRYGTPPSLDDVKSRAGPDVDGGVMYNLMLLPDDYDAGRKLKIIEERNYDRETRCPKARRGSPFPIRSKDFFDSVVKVVPDRDEEADLCAEMWDRDSRHPTDSTTSYRNRNEGNRDSPRWFFVGVLNGWPGFADVPLELMKIQHRDDTFLGRRMGWTTVWDRQRDGRDRNSEPSCQWKDLLHVRVRLRAPR